MSDSRLQAATAWLQQVFQHKNWRVEVASADASFRRYFRVIHDDGSTQILMDAPPEKEDIQPFIDVARRLLAVDLHAPEIMAENLDAGFLLLSDLGQQTYLPVLNADNVDRLYSDAMQAIQRMQKIPTEGLPAYDDQLLRTEMALFHDWYLGRHCGVSLSDTELSVWRATNDQLVENALAQPQVFVHRDYHSRNLMLIEDNNPGIIDFQDAVHGPVTYDLVSLLRDCYITWPRGQVEAWVEQFRQSILSNSNNDETSPSDFLRWFDLMGVQRHLKAIGIFARLNHRDGKPSYLQDIPRTLNYVYAVSSRYAELSGLQHLIDNHLAEQLAAANSCNGVETS